ncbi:MAG: hypothetical protein Q7V15_14325 [Phenylobacterium sp.]|uniref:hypothetical protein n=1 Tax=Phenylobacterium sp. TaxID=1871053 RepID=UPI002718E1B1|nr:hypothetical protein [Phenylobacterium sp.]MDO8902520.1 hypothetical protein [Phenylobacterium sp.]
MHFGKRVTRPETIAPNLTKNRMSLLSCLAGTAVCCASYIGFSPAVLGLEALTADTVESYNLGRLILSMAGSLPIMAVVFFVSMLTSQLLHIKSRNSTVIVFIAFPALVAVLIVSAMLTILTGNPPDDPWLPILVAIAASSGGLAMKVTLLLRDTRG